MHFLWDKYIHVFCRNCESSRHLANSYNESYHIQNGSIFWLGQGSSYHSSWPLGTCTPFMVFYLHTCFDYNLKVTPDQGVGNNSRSKEKEWKRWFSKTPPRWIQNTVPYIQHKFPEKYVLYTRKSKIEVGGNILDEVKKC